MAKIQRSLNGRDIILYGFSTCGWSHKVEQLLDQMGVSYVNVYVDLMGREDRELVLERIKYWTPYLTFPLLIVDNKKCVVGYDESRIIRAVEYD